MTNGRALALGLLLSIVCGSFAVGNPRAAVVPVASSAEPAPHPSNVSPHAFLETKVEWLLKRLENRRFAERVSKIREISAPATRNGWLSAIYRAGLVEGSDVTLHLTDKLLMAKVIDRLVGEKARPFHPKTIGVKEFLEKHDLLDARHKVVRDRARIEAALKREFPTGAICKPTTGMNNVSFTQGFYLDITKFIDDLLADDSPAFKPEDYSKPYTSEILLDAVTSGEMLLLQENVIDAAAALKPLRSRQLKEIRVHTLESSVITGASFPRWKTMDRAFPDADILAAEKYVQEFLALLPERLTARQAWSVDVARLENGEMRLLEINANRGREGQWSSFLPRPEVLGAYTRHIEERYNIRFTGLSGFLLRHNFGNYFRYLRKTYLEKSL